MPLTSGLPRWQKVATFLLLGTILIVVVASLRSGLDTRSAVKATEASTARRDCVTTLSTARNAVFQNMAIYQTIESDQLASALLGNVVGTKPTAAQVQAFGDNEAKLAQVLIEARRLQPPQTLNDLIAHGGVIDGQHYPACVG